ncbi:MAG: D-alanyl-D-alanine carboxypeptidase/D-alanyl-D-alanine-endopeptidase [Deltaproteobacteria bacterium]|nr:D-alanyl-D-alanine carboxypeptidase/D-alanyl-D-alanine-endopeptidase [Deltaproteobacteria bacterium]
MVLKFSIRLLICYCVFSLLLPVGIVKADVVRELTQLVVGTNQKFARAKRKPKFGVVVADARTGQAVFQHNASQLLIPASVLKVVTSVAALKILGGEHTYPSEIFVDRLPQVGAGKQGTIGNLYFRGYGDPILVDEKLFKIATAVYRNGVKTIENVVIDDTLFVDSPGASGNRPYQAGLSATSINHNSYAVDISPSALGKKAHVFLTGGMDGGDMNVELINEVVTGNGSGNRIILTQSPQSANFKAHVREEGSTAMGDERGGGNGSLEARLPRTIVKVRGQIGINSKLLTYYSSVAYPPAYLGTLLKHYLEVVGVEVRGGVQLGETAREAKLLNVFYSESLAKIIKDLNQFSNNFIAGQIFYSIGQDSLGYFRQDVAVERISGFLDTLGISRDSYAIFDGSGLNRENRITPGALTKVLVAAYSDFSIAPDFVSSLPRFGYSGTLRKRTLVRNRLPANSVEENARREAQVRSMWAKTGTLNGVSSIAGYAVGADDKAYTVVVISNGVSKGHAMQLEDEVFRIVGGVKR